MSFQIFLCFLILGLVFLYWRRLKSAVFFFFIATVIFVVVGQGWLGQALSDYLQPKTLFSGAHWKARNAIVVLGAGTVKWPEGELRTSHPLGFSRLHEATRLYRLCKQTKSVCKILTTGGDPRNKGISEAEVMKRELQELGVPEDEILMELKSNNTFQNAQFSSAILQKEFFDVVVVVTSGAHLKRSLRYFTHFGVKAEGAPSDRMPVSFFWIPTAQNFAITDILIHEAAGLVRYHLYNLLGWNVEATKPGSL